MEAQGTENTFINLYNLPVGILQKTLEIYQKKLDNTGKRFCASNS